jgi:hypothetical protein
MRAHRFVYVAPPFVLWIRAVLLQFSVVFFRVPCPREASPQTATPRQTRSLRGCVPAAAAAAVVRGLFPRFGEERGRGRRVAGLIITRTRRARHMPSRRHIIYVCARRGVYMCACACCVVVLGPAPAPPPPHHPSTTWLILPVVICLSQRLSHACLSINYSSR